MTPIAYAYQNLSIEGRKILGFGKYRGKCYEYVYMMDKNYCRWCLTLEGTNFLMYDFQQYIYKMNFF
jgi:hypothetical protein